MNDVDIVETFAVLIFSPPPSQSNAADDGNFQVGRSKVGANELPKNSDSIIFSLSVGYNIEPGESRSHILSCRHTRKN